MFDESTRAFLYPSSGNSFSIESYVFTSAESVLGERWSCPLLTEEADPCGAMYDGAAWVVEGIGTSIEYVMSQFLDPVFSLFAYMGTPESGGEYCFLGDRITISGKNENAPDGKTGYDYLILIVSASWLLYSVMRKN